MLPSDVPMSNTWCINREDRVAKNSLLATREVDQNLTIDCTQIHQSDKVVFVECNIRNRCIVVVNRCICHLRYLFISIFIDGCIDFNRDMLLNAVDGLDVDRKRCVHLSICNPVVVSRDY